MSQKTRLVVLISGSGSNLQALIDASEAGRLDGEIVAVFSNRANAYGLQRAERHHIPIIVAHPGDNRAEYDTALAALIGNYWPDWVILAGWMRILTMNFLGKFPNRVINLHPALPGQFAGTHAIERAFEAYQRDEIEQTGVMVHLVPDERVDAGPVLGQAVVPILAEDTLETLTERVHQTEHRLLVETVQGVITGEIEIPNE